MGCVTGVTDGVCVVNVPAGAGGNKDHSGRGPLQVANHISHMSHIRHISHTGYNSAVLLV